MSALVPRLIPFALAAFFAAASPLALAQVTLNLATAMPPQQTNCVVTTDSNGLSLAGSGSTALQATGVTYTGTGCGSGGSSAFNAQLTVQQPNIVAGTPANVLWSASPAATQCVYAGSAPAGANLGAAWTFGATACQGANCSTPHTTVVTPNAAGNYNLAVVCTNASGFAQGALTATPAQLPPQPVGFSLTAPSTAVVATPFLVSWTVTGATSCTGSASLSGSGSVSLPGWTDTVTTTSPRSVTAALAGTYTLGLACQNSAGTTTSQAATVTVTTVGGQCSGPTGLTRTTSGSVSYANQPGSVTRDYTQYTELWGYSMPGEKSGTAPPWPGLQASSPVLAMGRSNFIAAQFTVPAGVPTAWWGNISHTTYSYGIDVTAAISATCGDFNPVAACVNNGAFGGHFPTWQTAPTGNSCKLVPGTYYLNIKATDPLQVGAGGSCPVGQPVCPLATANNFNQ
jgi:hypothetical protein